jgi:transposase
MAGSRWEVSDELWAVIEPLLPAHPRRFRYPGRRRASERAALSGILFVLITGIPWRHLPQELGFGSGVTCWRRLEEWTKAGVWPQLHRELLERLRAADQIVNRPGLVGGSVIWRGLFLPEAGQRSDG